MATVEIPVIGPVYPVAVNGSSSTRKWKVYPAEGQCGVQILFVLHESLYWRDDYVGAQLMYSLDGRNWCDLKPLFRRLGAQCLDAKVNNVYVDLRLNVGTRGYINFRQVDGIEGGQNYPDTGSWEFDLNSDIFFYNRVVAGISLVIR